MDLDKIQALIKFVAKSGVHEVELETEEFKITIKTDGPKKRGAKGEEQQQVYQTMPVAMPMGQPVVQQVQPAQQAPAPAAEAPAPAPAAAPADDESKYITIKSPMIGTFYRSPSPDKPPFVEVGDTIKQGDVICIVEAMKLFNEVESEVSGKIVKVLVDDASPVEYDQPLFLVEP